MLKGYSVGADFGAFGEMSGAGFFGAGFALKTLNVKRAKTGVFLGVSKNRGLTFNELRNLLLHACSKILNNILLKC